MRKKMTGLLFLGLAFLSLAGCGASGEEENYLVSAEETYEKSASKEYEVKDNKALYEEEPEVVTMYLTVGQGNKEDGTDHTWTEVNSHPLTYYEENGIEPYRCEAVLQVGDEQGPVEGEFGYGERTANATVQLRGTRASSWQQKSYRIKIRGGKGDWRGQKTISLNKHLADPTRLKNRLSYALMEEIPQMMSARTQFVHLYVKDKTEGEEGRFQDYGLYTQVEQVNKTYLKNRNMDREGQLYQAGKDFDWERHPEAIRLATDPDYNEEQFQRYLEIDGSKEHDKVIYLLDAVNDPKISMEDVVARYFDEQNLYYWMAFHILMGNQDVLDGNYYLYSPRGVDRWYFISWDNDGVLREGYEFLRDQTYDRSWNYGIFTYADTALFRRILQEDSCRQALDAAVEDLYQNVLTVEKVEKKIREYAAVVKEYLYQLPDRTFARVTEEDYEVLVDSMAGEIAENYERYRESLTSVWPFHILEPTAADGAVTLRWEEAYQYGGGAAAYTAELARDYSFADCLLDTSTSETSYEAGTLPAGQYFLRIRASGENHTVQDAYEYYRTEEDSVCGSTLCFYVQEDGSVAALRYHEDD